MTPDRTRLLALIDRALNLTDERLVRAPDYPVFRSIREQLAAIRQDVLRAGRFDPALQQRINIGSTPCGSSSRPILTTPTSWNRSSSCTATTGECPSEEQGCAPPRVDSTPASALRRGLPSGRGRQQRGPSARPKQHVEFRIWVDVREVRALTDHEVAVAS